MRIDVITIFPSLVHGVLSESLIGRAVAAGTLDLHIHDLRDWATDRLRAQEVSIGDYVVSGGELPALVLIEAVTRLVPGVLGNDASAGSDSLSEPGLLDHPVYTRPQEFRGMRVPDVLLSGDHAAI